MFNFIYESVVIVPIFLVLKVLEAFELFPFGKKEYFYAIVIITTIAISVTVAYINLTGIVL